MSVNLSQLLTEARTLVTRLHDRDKITDHLLNQTHTLNDKIKCMKEYKEDVNEFTEVNHQPSKPRSAIVHNLQQENRQIKHLQEENRQLKIMLEEYQAALDLIMHRYRLQVMQMVQLNKIQTITEQAVEALQNDSRPDDMGKMVEFARVFNRCLKIGEDNSTKDQEELSRLQTENQCLRQLLKIAAQNDYSAAKTFVDFLHERSPDGNETPKSSSDDQHTPTSETVDLDLSSSSRSYSVESTKQRSLIGRSPDADPLPNCVADSNLGDKLIKDKVPNVISTKIFNKQAVVVGQSTSQVVNKTSTMISRKSLEKGSSNNDIKVGN